MMRTVKPSRLHPGDKIGLVAPSFPFPTKDTDFSNYHQQYVDGKKEMEKMGFELTEGKNLKKTRWWMAGTPEERAEDINLMYADPKIKAIIGHDGGHAAIDILEHLDFELIAKNPKPFIGFSDITNLLVAMFAKTGLVGFHMGLLSYTYVWHQLIRDESIIDHVRKTYTDLLTSTKPLGKIIPVTKWEKWRNGEAEGILFGGNLSMLVSLLGTEYFPSLVSLKGSILFWEIDNTPSYRIQRSLYQLKYAGILDVISGMLIGKMPDIKPTGWKGLYEPEPREIIMDIVKDYDFPIMAEVDFGHKNINLPMPIGIKTGMNTADLNLEFMESAVI